MGQAKQRKAEIAELKAAGARVMPTLEVDILAIRHTRIGKPEFVYYTANLGKAKNSKDALLHRICTRDWLHNPPCDHIAEYLVQTNTYQHTQLFGKDGSRAYVINFHEIDEEFTAKHGKPTYSCREIWCADRDGIRDMAKNMRDGLDDADYSIRQHYDIA